MNFCCFSRKCQKNTWQRKTKRSKRQLRVSCSRNIRGCICLSVSVVSVGYIRLRKQSGRQTSWCMRIREWNEAEYKSEIDPRKQTFCCCKNDLYRRSFDCSRTLESLIRCRFFGVLFSKKSLDLQDTDKESGFLYAESRVSDRRNNIAVLQSTAFNPIHQSANCCVILWTAKAKEGKKERVTLVDYNSVHTLQEIREGAGVYITVKKKDMRRLLSVCSDTDSSNRAALVFAIV